MTCDVNPRYVAADPQTGAAHAVAEAALNLACVGARPLAVTDCLNFGNPERPEILGQFAAAIRGISEACRVFETPVVSGNVSLYNETDGVSILPTPTVGMVGLLDDVTRSVGFHFAHEGDVVALLGTTRDEMGASEYLATVLGRDEGPCPPLDFASARALVNMLLEPVRDGMLSSAHDVSEGGLAVALAEAAMGPGGFGADLDVEDAALVHAAALLADGGARRRFAAAGRERDLVEAARRYGVADRAHRPRRAAPAHGLRQRRPRVRRRNDRSQGAFRNRISETSGGLNRHEEAPPPLFSLSFSPRSRRVAPSEDGRTEDRRSGARVHAAGRLGRESRRAEGSPRRRTRRSSSSSSRRSARSRTRYNERMAALGKEYAAKGIVLVGINSNKTEPAPR